MNRCPFCAGDLEVIMHNDVAYAIYDKYPVSQGHLLVIPKRHVASYFETTREEKLALWGLLEDCKEFLDKSLHPDGYNVGINIGQTAGQTVPHLHIHLIPRYVGDMEDPRGGVRGVIPDKQKYGIL